MSCRWLLTAMLPLCALILIVAQHATHLETTRAMGSTKLPGSLSPRLASSRLQREADPERRITLSIGLRPRNQTALDGYARELVQPHSAVFHHFLSPAQFGETF